METTLIPNERSKTQDVQETKRSSSNMEGLDKEIVDFYSSPPSGLTSSLIDFGGDSSENQLNNVKKREEREKSLQDRYLRSLYENYKDSVMARQTTASDQPAEGTAQSVVTQDNSPQREAQAKLNDPCLYTVKDCDELLSRHQLRHIDQYAAFHFGHTKDKMERRKMFFLRFGSGSEGSDELNVHQAILDFKECN